MIAATAFVLGATALGAGVVGAATQDRVNPMNNLVKAISQKFNLSTSDVQTVVDDVMKAKHAEIEAKFKEASSERIAQAVSDGKITQAQADLIKAKMAELQAAREDKKENIESFKSEITKWAADNNIPEEYLRPGFGKGMGHHGPEGR